MSRRIKKQGEEKLPTSLLIKVVADCSRFTGEEFDNESTNITSVIVKAEIDEVET